MNNMKEIVYFRCPSCNEKYDRRALITTFEVGKQCPLCGKVIKEGEWEKHSLQS